MAGEIVQTRCLPFSPDAVREAAALVARGRPVAVATETVYGLAADATSGPAVAAIYHAKGRPAFNPLIVHVSGLAAAQAIADLGEAELALAAAFWPGPLTIVAPLRSTAGIATLTTAGLATVAIRVPAHPAMQALLAAAGKPLAAPSANRSAAISPTRAAHVLRSLAGRIPLVIDSGACTLGLESTIVRVRGGRVRLLRPGPITAEELNRVVAFPTVAGGSSEIDAPGQLAQHYAPGKPLRLDADAADPDEWLIGFGSVAGDATLSARADLGEAAANLFDRLHEADASPRARIAVAPVPVEGLGRAINDRLSRAAA